MIKTRGVVKRKYWNERTVHMYHCVSVLSADG